MESCFANDKIKKLMVGDEHKQFSIKDHKAHDPDHNQ